MAGGSGRRLWSMSRAVQPTQLIPFIDGKSLPQVAFDRLGGLNPGRGVDDGWIISAGGPVPQRGFASTDSAA